MRGTYKIQILSGFSRARDFPLALAKISLEGAGLALIWGKALSFLNKKIK